MGIVTDQDDLAPGAQPLNEEELRWIRSLERLLKRMPPRLLLIEIGDAIEVVDREASRGVHLEDGNAYRNGVMLGSVDDGTFVCTAYAPRSGFWMLPEDPSDKPHNVSERAVNRTFHPIDEPERIVEMRRAGLASMGICERCGDAGKTDGCAAYAVSVDPPVRSG